MFTCENTPSSLSQDARRGAYPQKWFGLPFKQVGFILFDAKQMMSRTKEKRAPNNRRRGHETWTSTRIIIGNPLLQRVGRYYFKRTPGLDHRGHPFQAGEIEQSIYINGTCAELPSHALLPDGLTRMGLNADQEAVVQSHVNQVLYHNGRGVFWEGRFICPMQVGIRDHATAACFHRDHLRAAAESRHKDDMILVIKRPGSSGIGSMIKPPQFLTGPRVIGIGRLGSTLKSLALPSCSMIKGVL